LQPDPFIEFADDNTFVDKLHGKALMKVLEREHVRWFTETDISVASDNELLGLMRDAGCAQILIGFESATREGLVGVETRSDWKARQFDNYMTAIEKIQSYGITVNGCFVLGMDNQGPECFEDVLRFVQDSKLYDVQITMMTAFPGTPLYDRLQEEGRLLEPDAWELCTLFDANFRPKNMSKEFLESRFRWLVEKLYSQEFTNARHQGFHDRLAVPQAR
jgi:radical SAM superfamily enzyme YgiQ (UPF0313 family)